MGILLIPLTKTWLVTKDQHIHNAAKIFAGSAINITSHGRPYLGAPLGSPEFIEDHISSKVGEWTASITILSEIAISQPHAAYSALTHGLSSKWSYLSRVTPSISHLLSPLDIALRTKLLPALTGRPTPNNLECALFALPTRHGGLGIRIPSKNAERELQSSLQATSSLVANILEQNRDYGYDIIDHQLQSKASIRRQNDENNSKEAADLHSKLPLQLQKAVDLAKEKGVSTWLTALPLKEHGEKTYFDVRVFNPYAPSNKNQTPSACYRKHKREKKRAYDQRVREVEHSSFTPLVFSATGGMGREATCFYKRLASMLANKWDQPYSTTLWWLRCRLTFSLIRSAIQALRGARSSQGHAVHTPDSVDLVVTESRITPDP